MSEPFLGQITIFAGNFSPRGWAYCNGQLLAITQNTALFSLLGTTYGGDGRTTFGLPDLRGRVPRHSGGNSPGPGLPAVRLGEKGGAISRTLTVNHLPNHTHTGRIKASADAANTSDPSNNALALAEAYSDQALASTSPLTKAGTVQIDSSGGGGQPIVTLPPYLGVNYLIAIQGYYPSRN
jgi:microcystin-dependent protein